MKKVCRNCHHLFTIPNCYQQRRKCCSVSCRHKWFSIEKRFWRNVKKTSSCWMWTSSTNDKGYGQTTITRKHKVHQNVSAHRMAYELTYGSIPGNQYVLHQCDNPPCVKPDHLYLGTAQDNINDCVRKNRNSFGEHRYCAKLLISDVQKIRLSYNGQRGHFVILGNTYGVTPETISNIVRRKTWKQVINARTS